MAQKKDCTLFGSSAMYKSFEDETRFLSYQCIHISRLRMSIEYYWIYFKIKDIMWQGRNHSESIVEIIRSIYSRDKIVHLTRSFFILHSEKKNLLRLFYRVLYIHMNIIKRFILKINDKHLPQSEESICFFLLSFSFK